MISVIWAVLFACSSPPVVPPAPSLTLTDALGREVAIPEAPSRLVASGPGALRMLAYLAVGPEIVGVEGSESKLKTPYILAHPEWTALPVIGPGGPAQIGQGPEPEATLAVHPDLLVITSVDRATADALSARLSVPVLVVSQGELGTVDERLESSLDLLGTALSREARAAEVRQFLQDQRARLKARTEGLPPVEGLYVGGVAFKGFQGLGSTTTRYLPLDLLGISHLSAGLPGQGPQRTVSLEQLHAWQPQVVLLDASGAESVRAEAAQHPAVFEGLTAFSSGNVYTMLPYNTYSANLDTALADAWAAGAVLYPEAFAGVEPAAEANRIYTALLGRPMYAPMAQVYGGFSSFQTVVTAP